MIGMGILFLKMSIVIELIYLLQHQMVMRSLSHILVNTGKIGHIGSVKWVGITLLVSIKCYVMFDNPCIFWFMCCGI